MTTVEEIPAPVEPTAPRPWWGRMPFAAHAALLTVLLVATGWFVGPRASFLPDEGAVILQARMLSGGHGWFERPALLESINPSGTWYPLDNADQAARGFAPFAKHPVYALLAAGAYRVGGVAGIIGLSVLGTLAAALLSAALARRFDPGLAVPCLWVVGVASPLYFDGFMAVATSMAAACGVGAVLASACFMANRVAQVKALGAAAGVGVALGAAVLMRSEAVIMAIALAIVLGLMAVMERRMIVLLPAVTALGGGFVARLAETKLRGHVLGAASPATALGVAGTVPNTPAQSFLGARFSGFDHTWLEASHYRVPLGDAFLMLLWVLVGVLAVMVRRRNMDRGLVGLVAGGVLVASVGRLLISPRVPVPGLLIAFPLLWGGILLLSRQDWNRLGVLTLGGGAIFSAGVIATQYSVGGSLEWGGRYFAMGIPIVVPPVLVAIRRRGLSLDSVVRRAANVALIGASVSMALLAALSLRSQHSDSRQLGETVVALSPPVAQGAVVVTNVPWVARLVWTAYSGRDWLYVPPDDFGTAANRLEAVGRDEVTVVTVGTDCRAGQFPGYHIIDHRSAFEDGRLWQIARLRIGPGATDCGTGLKGGG